VSELELRGERTLTGWDPDGNVPPGFAVRGVVVGRDDAQLALEVVVLDAEATSSMSRETLGRFHAARLGRRVIPVVVLARRDGHAWLFGPNGQAAVVGPLPVDQAHRLLQSALEEPTGLAARQRLAGMYAAIDGTRAGTEAEYLPGVANAGLFATHELRHGVRQRSDWPSACEDSGHLLPLRREALIEALGYTAHSVAASALVLLADGVTSRAVAVLLDENESFDGDSRRFSVSPVAYAVSIAQKHELSWVMILRGSQLRLYPARAELGVGRKGLAETYFEVDLALVTDESAGFLPLVFAAEALSPKGSTAEILASSAQYAVALGGRLRGQVYEQIVPRLSLAIAPQLPALGHPLDRPGLDLAYQLTLRVFFRLLFQAYAEDRKLLPFGENPRYDRNALNTLAHDLVEDPDEVFDSNSASMWDDLTQVWHVIDKGDTAWSVPPYNGGLFGCDAELQPEGELLERISVTNDVMGPVLRAMLIDTAEGITGPIDFRSLSVREFGTIYEGLLESNLAVADTDLTLDDNDTWVPAKPLEPLDPERSAAAGTVYFHNTSGQRKGTGSYFTPSFVVEHLLERALDPTLAEHLARVKEKLDAGDQAGAADLFFDFRVADLAMGSGHFLTAAIDHLEAGMAAFLSENPIPGVTNELRHLEQAARNAMGNDALDPEPSSLLRRQIARRCIYGLDINPIAVELARVSIWIHTFVRGLPMSSLDHNLVCANSLTGIGTVEESLDALVPERTRGMAGATTIFDAPIQDALDRARTTLTDIANAAEATRKEAQDAARGSRRAQNQAKEAKLLLDAAVLVRIGMQAITAAVDPAELACMAAEVSPQEVLRPLAPAHMPVLFPEVFLRQSGGFDVLVGNPPWEKVKIEADKWWGARVPGIFGLRVGERDVAIEAAKAARPDLALEYEDEIAHTDRLRAVLGAGPFPGLGKGDVDLYQAFAWRNLQLAGVGGSVGIVTPRSLISEAGGEAWRERVFDTAEFEDVTLLINTGRWAFDMEPRYSIALITLLRTGAPATEVALAGPFASRSEFESSTARKRALFPAQQFRTWGTGGSFPILSTAEDGDLYLQLRSHPRLDADVDAWRARGVRETDSALDKHLFHLDMPQKGDWPVYKGESFDLWNPDTGTYYGGVDPTVIVEHLQAKRRRQARMKSSAFSEFPPGTESDPSTLPIHRPRIAFRKITRATDTRSLRVALVPRHVTLTDGAPYLLFTRGSEAAEAYVLGVLSSLPADWMARRVVEVNMNYHVIHGLAVPRPSVGSPLAERVIEVVGSLAGADERFDDWVRSLGVTVGSSTVEGTEDELIAELDALVSRLYGLSRRQLEHVFATFHRGWAYGPRLEKVLGYFDALEGVE
jgi:hypothetical protein